MKMSLTLPRQIWFAVFGMALLLGFGWVATTTGPLAPIEVTVTHVVKGEVSLILFGIGVVEARRGYLMGPGKATLLKYLGAMIEPIQGRMTLGYNVRDGRTAEEAGEARALA
jgi:hypothetical protein